MRGSKTIPAYVVVASLVVVSCWLFSSAPSLAMPPHVPADSVLAPPAFAADSMSAATLDPLVEQLEGPGLPLPPPPGVKPIGEDIPGHWQMIPTYQDVPEYRWWHGCSPTAAGMLFGWWDAQAGTENLFAGNAASFWGDGSESVSGGTRAMVAATSHIVAGQENGYVYGDWHNSPSYPEHEMYPMSLADFMKTVNGGTARSRMATGLEGFASWDAPWTATNESYPAMATTYYVSSGWTFADFQAELDAGYPVHLGIRGHSVLALGWYDLRTAAQPDDYGYIAYNTWGWGLTEWRWDGENVPNRRSVYAATYLRVVPEPLVAWPLWMAAGFVAATAGRTSATAELTCTRAQIAGPSLAFDRASSS